MTNHITRSLSYLVGQFLWLAYLTRTVHLGLAIDLDFLSPYKARVEICKLACTNFRGA